MNRLEPTRYDVIQLINAKLSNDEYDDEYKLDFLLDIKRLIESRR